MTSLTIADHDIPDCSSKTVVITVPGRMGRRSNLPDAQGVGLSPGLTCSSREAVKEYRIYLLRYHALEVHHGLRGTLNVIKVALSMMRRTKTAESIMITSSATAYSPEHSLPIYSASKLGLIGLVRALRSTLPLDNITINAVAPATTITGLLPPHLAAPIIAAGLPTSSSEFVGASDRPLGHCAAGSSGGVIWEGSRELGRGVSWPVERTSHFDIGYIIGDVFGKGEQDVLREDEAGGAITVDGDTNGFTLPMTVTPLVLSMFFISLENAIIASPSMLTDTDIVTTAVPMMENKFGDIELKGWYASALLINLGGFELPWGTCTNSLC
ncbi:uncharacterized protein BO97DRAFT_426113 [Aspergillus homomorphus CBS 101889]|uniref:NAD(P)-binding protein n=1 Tax=Aspergillus homomorphus (strain CBS 101889) TaxID=1450537 RepID=A0A395HTN8_ASPHC|nr:hypothetical protein BO97DRAFT_426113 [Aspergillus homomorphus CBS 101889]RAL10869.1 hypothetical protein BO97DRAFT_426113 [Aspergillus homomorphus CBS 101889]